MYEGVNITSINYRYWQNRQTGFDSKDKCALLKFPIFPAMPLVPSGKNTTEVPLTIFCFAALIEAMAFSG